jgi:hypothetical protein
MEFAASDRAGEAVIRVVENPSTASLVWHRENPAATSLTIETVLIDQLVESGTIGYPKFVKIDVEGFEGSVLNGMRRTLADARPILFIECSDVGRQMSWALLPELGYQCQSAITHKPVHEFEGYRHSDFRFCTRIWNNVRLARIWQFVRFGRPQSPSLWECGNPRPLGVSKLRGRQNRRGKRSIIPPSGRHSHSEGLFFPHSGGNLQFGRLVEAE